jgi:hypothetical protein
LRGLPKNIRCRKRFLPETRNILAQPILTQP